MPLPLQSQLPSAHLRLIWAASHLQASGRHPPKQRQALQTCAQQASDQQQQAPQQSERASASKKASSLRAQLVALKQEIDTADKAAFLAAFEADQDGLGTALEGTAEQPAQPAVGAGPAEEQQQKSAQAEEPAQEQAPVQGQEQQLEAGVARQASPKQNLSREERRKQADAWRQSKRQNQPEPTQPSYPQQEVVMQRPPQLLAPPEGPPPGIGEEALAAEGSGYEILLQGFNWESHHQGWYRKLMEQADTIAAAGVTTIWLPPPTDSVSQQGYMPTDLYNLNSRYGSEDELRRCVAKLQQAGLKVLADIVINHRCAQGQDSKGIWNQFGGRMDWDARAIVRDDKKFGGKGNRSSGDSWPGAPNLDHSQDFVRNDLTEWLQWMRNEIGFDGWRFDFVRGYGGRYVQHYVQNTTPSFAVAEFWDTLDYEGSIPKVNQDRHRQQMIDWINDGKGTALCFDFTLKGILHAAFEVHTVVVCFVAMNACLQRNEFGRLRDREGRPPGLTGWWPARSSPFLCNHDCDSTQGHWRFPRHGLEQGYAYLLTHPGTPCLFWDDLMEPRLQQSIRTLIGVRQRNGIHCRSEVWIKHAERSIYVAEIDGCVLMKMGPARYQPEEAYWRSVASGHHWEIWEKGQQH